MDKQELEINLSEIPDHVRIKLARAALDLVKHVLSQPCGREMLDRETERRRLKSEPINSPQTK
ncbi:hypothetical protein H9X86_11375 [Pseudoflavonifractor capillosus]|uniref:hypothetical protein n=1 Tax=Pseudoflavonifractor capillosus TaxID=106588 RepID=UPI00195CB887|nr:hypothetical protein [Pseudoflavonifractor capillosus]MBM6897940.1 hypothetical protein [Pseudoflavonifractor capillosus]